MDRGFLIISLDFELHWGVFDKFGDEYQKNLEGARRVVPEILKLFDNYNIHATWATVGLLFARSKKEIKKWSPSVDNHPTYVNESYSPYRINIGKDENVDPIHFACSLIEQINSTEGQELATHTFSHYYCLEKGQTKEQFEADIQAAIKAAEKYNLELGSIVFPRNQVNNRYLSVLKKYGIKSYRGNEPDQIYKANNTRKYNRLDYKGRRLVDSYFNITGHGTYDFSSLKKKSGVLNIPSSQFLRPYNNYLSFLEPFKLRRIKKSMEHAAKNNEIYHLWWHPHNFGINIVENLSMLKEILTHHQILSAEYNMQSVTMNEIADIYNKDRTGKG